MLASVSLVLEPSENKAGGKPSEECFLGSQSLERFPAVRCAIEKVVVHTSYHAVLVQHVRDAAVDFAKHGTLHLPLFAHLVTKGNESAFAKSRVRPNPYYLSHTTGAQRRARMTSFHGDVQVRALYKEYP